MAVKHPHDIVVFTLHKSASMFLHKLCLHLSQLAGLTYYSPNGGDHEVPLRRFLDDPEVWTGRHGCFAPLRVPVPVPDMDAKKVILHLRDPRDVLVAMYFSTRSSVFTAASKSPFSACARAL